MFFLVSFDIVDDPARARVVKVLKEYGTRVQKSVFECPGLTESRFVTMKNRIEELIDMGEDSVRYYSLCRTCLAKVEFAGTGRGPDQEEFRVV